MTTDSSKPEGAPDRGTPETFRARAVSISLTVKDVHASLAWYEGVRDGRVRPGDLVLIEALGGGLTWGAAAIRL